MNRTVVSAVTKAAEVLTSIPTAISNSSSTLAASASSVNSTSVSTTTSTNTAIVNSIQSVMEQHRSIDVNYGLIIGIPLGAFLLLLILAIVGAFYCYFASDRDDEVTANSSAMSELGLSYSSSGDSAGSERFLIPNGVYKHSEPLHIAQSSKVVSPLNVGSLMPNSPPERRPQREYPPVYDYIRRPLPRFDDDSTLSSLSRKTDSSYVPESTPSIGGKEPSVSNQSVSSISFGSTFPYEPLYDNAQRVAKEANVNMEELKERLAIKEQGFGAVNISVASTASPLNSSGDSLGRSIRHSTPLRQEDGCQSCVAISQHNKYCPRVHNTPRPAYNFREPNPLPEHDPRVPINFVGPRVREQSPRRLSPDAINNLIARPYPQAVHHNLGPNQNYYNNRGDNNANVANAVRHRPEHEASLRLLDEQIDRGFDRLFAVVNGSPPPPRQPRPGPSSSSARR